ELEKLGGIAAAFGKLQRAKRAVYVEVDLLVFESATTPSLSPRFLAPPPPPITTTTTKLVLEANDDDPRLYSVLDRRSHVKAILACGRGRARGVKDMLFAFPRAAYSRLNERQAGGARRSSTRLTSRDEPKPRFQSTFPSPPPRNSPQKQSLEKLALALTSRKVSCRVSAGTSLERAFDSSEDPSETYRAGKSLFSFVAGKGERRSFARLTSKDEPKPCTLSPKPPLFRVWKRKARSVKDFAFPRAAYSRLNARQAGGTRRSSARLTSIDEPKLFFQTTFPEPSFFSLLLLIYSTVKKCRTKSELSSTFRESIRRVSAGPSVEGDRFLRGPFRSTELTEREAGRRGANGRLLRLPKRANFPAPFQRFSVPPSVGSTVKTSHKIGNDHSKPRGKYPRSPPELPGTKPPFLRTLPQLQSWQVPISLLAGGPTLSLYRPRVWKRSALRFSAAFPRAAAGGKKGALVSASAPRLRSLRKQPLYETSLLAACLLADAARTCREGPRTPNSRPSSARQADSETQLGSPCTASPRPLLLESPSEDSQPRVRCVERKGVCGQKGALVSASAPRLRSLRKQPLYETSLLAACLLADAARTCREGPRTPNSRPSSARQADSETQLGSPCTASPRPLLLASPSEDSQPRVRCVERKGVCGQKGALVSASATRLRSLRKQPLYETSFLAALSAGGCCTDVQRGPRTPNSRPSSASQADSGTQLGSSSTASPPHKRASSEVSRSTVRCVERKGVCGQKGALVSASAPRLRSLRKQPLYETSLLAACLLAAAAWTCREGPRTPNSRPSSARQADSETQLGSPCTASPRPLLLASPSEDSQPRVRCVERKGVCGQKGALVSASATRLRSLRKQPLYETSFLAALSAGGCCTDVQRGPRTPNSRPSSASQADSGTQLGSSSTASPPHKFLGNRSRGKSCPNRYFCPSPTLAPEATSLRNLSLTQLFLLAAAAWTCREGPRTPNSRPSSARQADSETQLVSPCTASPRPLLLASPSEDSQPRVRCVERKGVCGQKGALVSASAPRLRSLRKQPLYETSLLAACLLADAARTCREGPRTPNSRPSSASQADSETQLGSPCTASPRPLLLESPSEDSQPRVRCVERKGVCGQKGALVSASATRLRSLRKQPLYETSFLAALSAGGCCTDVQRGPRTPNSRPSSASQADSGTQLGSSSTASPPHKGASSEVSRSTVRCVERKGVCGQKGALVSASAPRLRSLRKQPLYEKSFLAACLLAAAAWTCKRGPRTPNSRPSSARQADNGTQLWLFFYCVSTSSPPHESLGNRSQGKSCPNR
ncbi:hypothetical protein Avbf_01613, partial [Armadillidium vulgare]